MNVVTGRGAAREHEQPSPGRIDRDGAPPEPRGQMGVSPRPRPHPTPAQPAPDPQPDPSGPAVPVEPATGVPVEPTTGAPVDALPNRVPIRERRASRRAVGGADDDDSWLPIEKAHWDGTPIRTEEQPSALTRWAAAWRDRAWRRRRPRAVRQRDPLPGLTGLLVLTLLATFFAWVSVEPFWLAVGHHTAGSVVAECTGSGIGQRCRGVFVAADERFVAHGVRVSGLDAGPSATVGPVPARMTGPEGATAYADPRGVLHLRWLLGFTLVAACAAGIIRVTGTAGLSGRRARRWAVALAAGGPAMVAAGLLVAAF